MTLQVVDGGLAGHLMSVRTARAHTSGPHAYDDLSDDLAARKRELLVVLELCAARERGARELESIAGARQRFDGSEKRTRAPGRLRPRRAP